MKRAALPACLLVTSGLAIVLAAQNAQLKRESTEIRKTIQFAHKDMWIPAFDAKTMDGGIVRIGDGGGKGQILVYLSPDCKFCEQSMPFISEMDRFSRQYGDLEMIGLTKTDGEAMRAFIKKHEVKFPVAVIKDARLLSLMKFGPTPTVINVRKTGQVSFAKLGLIASSKEAALIMLDAIRMDADLESAEKRGPSNETGI
jgi:peroxiredoxin